jgi:glycosyltransferase involved in cell wall biosynthesis
MKILQFIASKGYMGAERSFVELCNELGRTERVYAMVFEKCGFSEKLDGNVEQIHLRSNSSRYNPMLFAEIYRHIGILKPDVIHVHSGKATQIMYHLSLITGKRFDFIATKRNLRREKIFDKVPHVAAISRAVYDQVENVSKYLIYNGVRYMPVTHNEKGNDVFTILAVGALRKVKGFEYLIKAVSRLEFDFRLRIVGEGEERENLRRHIRRFGLEKKVEILGYREDIPELLSGSDLQVVSSVSEGFSRAIVEGLFYSDVLISTHVGIAPEILPAEFLSRPEELPLKIEEVYKEYELFRRKFYAVKSRYIGRFTTGGMTKEYMKLYEQVRKEASYGGS